MVGVLGRRNGQLTLNTDRPARSASSDVDPALLIAVVTRVVGRPSSVGTNAFECLEAQRVWPEAVAFILQHGPHMSPMTRRRVLSAMQGFLLLDVKPSDNSPNRANDADATI